VTLSGGRYRAAISRSGPLVPGAVRVTGPSTDIYRVVGAARSTMSVKRPAACIRRAFRDPASVSTHASPPGSYWYQIGKLSGPRPGPADTDKAAMCGPAKNSSRSCADKRLSAIDQNLTVGTDRPSGDDRQRS
jgi:hypothetical protein